MNITQKYALECGIKVGEAPKLDECFYPLVDKNIIIFDTRSVNQDGCYDYFSDIVKNIKFLKDRGYSFFQFADSKSFKLDVDKVFIGLNPKQESFIIKRSKLLISNQNYTLYLSACLGVKSIGLYSLFDSKTVAPIWNTHLQAVFNSHRNGNLPSYGRKREIPKTINLIDPFKVSQSIFDCLGIKSNIGKNKLIHLGKAYCNNIVEIIPDYLAPKDFMAGQFVNLRFDCLNSLTPDYLFSWLSGRKINILTDKDFNPIFLKDYAENVRSISINTTDKITKEFIEKCRGFGFEVKLYCNNRDKISEYRFKFLDYDVFEDFPEELSKEVLDLITENAVFSSSKSLYSKGLKYSCKQNFLMNKPFDGKDEPVILTRDFLDEVDFIKIYEPARI